MLTVVQIYEWCQKRIPDFSEHEHWSSNIYSLKEQGKYADFTYLDLNGYMGRALGEAKVKIMPGWGPGTTFHLEVKSAQGRCRSRPMIVSTNQVKKVS